MAISQMTGAYDLDPSATVAVAAQADYQARSDEAAKLPGAKLDLAYGDAPRQRLDIFSVPGEMAPVLLFIHGGYWRAGAKDTRRFAAPAWRDQSVCWVPVGYRLAPDATMDEIVDDVRSALAWIYREGSRHGCDPNRIHVCGNSAGGHLAALLGADGWQADYGVPEDVVKSVTAVSGLYDLEPFRSEMHNEWLKLDEAAAMRNSPVHVGVRAGLTFLLALGGQETPAFKYQSDRFAATCRAAGAPVRGMVCADDDHFTVIARFGDPDSPLFEAMRQMIEA